MSDKILSPFVSFSIEKGAQFVSAEQKVVDVLQVSCSLGDASASLAHEISSLIPADVPLAILACAQKVDPTLKHLNVSAHSVVVDGEEKKAEIAFNDEVSLKRWSGKGVAETSALATAQAAANAMTKILSEADDRKPHPEPVRVTHSVLLGGGWKEAPLVFKP